MLDLDDAGRRLASFPVGVPTPRQAIERRGRRRQRRRRALEGGAATALAAGLIVAGLQLASHQGTQSVAVRATPTTTVPLTHAPTAPPVVSAPRGWVLHEIGLLAFDTPNWASDSSRSTYTAGPCRHRGDVCVIDPELVARASIPPAGSTRTSINGLAVWKSTEGPTEIYDIPSTGIELLLRGTDARSIARTLQSSSTADILAAHYPLTLPADWQSVTYDGVTLEVPPSWAVRYRKRSDKAADGADGCSVAGASTIYLGSIPTDCSIDKARYPYGPWLWLGQETGRSTGGKRMTSPSDEEALHTDAPGLRITLSFAGIQAPVIGAPPALKIQTATGTLHMQVGIGQSSPVLEEEIFGSIHLSGRESAPSPIQPSANCGGKSLLITEKMDDGLLGESVLTFSMTNMTSTTCELSRHVEVALYAARGRLLSDRDAVQKKSLHGQSVAAAEIQLQPGDSAESTIAFSDNPVLRQVCSAVADVGFTVGGQATHVKPAEPALFCEPNDGKVTTYPTVLSKT